MEIRNLILDIAKGWKSFHSTGKDDRNHPIQIYPGSPWENGYNERFNGTLRHEVLNAEWFATTKQAQIVINQWLRQYNHIRPQHALNMRAPVPETVSETGT
ncbi:MAG: transposase [Gammaproteobacteria bacterium]|nr:transposase [Gammaproteobacteria bacterium]